MKKNPSFIIFYSLAALVFVSLISILFLSHKGYVANAQTLIFGKFQNKLYEYTLLNIAMEQIDDNVSYDSIVFDGGYEGRFYITKLDNGIKLLDIYVNAVNPLNATAIRSSKRIIVFK